MPVSLRLKRLGLTAGMWLVALNIWTGGPLFALWVGSQAQGSGNPTMTSVFVVVLVMAAACFGLLALLWRLGAAHDALTGSAPTVRAARPLAAQHARRAAALGRRAGRADAGPASGPS